MLSGCVYVMAFYQLPLVVDEVTKGTSPLLLFCISFSLPVSQPRFCAKLEQRSPRQVCIAAFCLYWFLGVMMDGTAAGLGWLAGIPVSPHFDAPYLSSSVSEFWSKRWNLTVGNSLRLLVYDPINEGESAAETNCSHPESFFGCRTDEIATLQAGWCMWTRCMSTASCGVWWLSAGRSS